MANAGAAALTAARACCPDAVLLDGWQVGRHLLRLGPVRPLVLAVTGYGTAADHQRSRDEGFDHHLVKPVDPARLIAILRERADSLSSLR